jgi:DNA-directed RNA polymerase subunit RPC12/RpoP
MDERDFFTERPEQKPAEYTCPRCKRRHEYMVRWMRRTKKPQLPPRADARDRALYAKLRDYLIRMDDDVTCKSCSKRFEIPSHQSMVFLDGPSQGPAPSRPGARNEQGKGGRGAPDDEDDDNRGNRA